MAHAPAECQEKLMDGCQVSKDRYPETPFSSSEICPEITIQDFHIFRGINETMSSLAPRHRLLWVTSKLKATVRAHCFRSFLTALFLSIICAASSIDCAGCSLKSRCTQAPTHGLDRHLYEHALNRMQERVTPGSRRILRKNVFLSLGIGVPGNLIRHYNVRGPFSLLFLRYFDCRYGLRSLAPCYARINFENALANKVLIWNSGRMVGSSSA